MALIEGIEIDTAVLRDTAANVKNINVELDDKLADIKNVINNMENDFQTDGSREIVESMNNLQPRFNEYKSVLDSYADFLITTATSYESTEQAEYVNAQSLRQ